MTFSVFNNNNPVMMLSSSPNSSTTKSCKRNAGDLLSNPCTTGSSSHQLRPLLYHHHHHQDEYHLPSIHNVVSMSTPTSSPSPPSSSYYYSSPTSSIASPSTPSALDDEEEDLLNSSVRRKGSIASLLNSDPELKQLDKEQSRCNYHSHFFDNYALKRGRPSIDEIVISHKKQRIMDPSDSVKNVCQSSVVAASANESVSVTKGLRHFSKQVCDKVAKKGITTYNEVADELALDIQQQHCAADGQKKQAYDQKNIRRRVYDALNVLMAMNIIAKDKKVITWLGIPAGYKQPNAQDNSELLDQIKAEQLRSNQLLGSLQMLRTSVSSTLEKHVQIRNLIGRNQSRLPFTTEQQRVELPLFVICASSADNLHLDMQKDRQSATVSFQQQRRNHQHIVYRDIDILRHVSLF